VNLRAYKVDDLAIAEGGSAPYRGSECRSSEPVAEIVHEDPDLLCVSGFEWQGVRRARSGERPVKRGCPEVGPELNEDAEDVPK
jgi:hypothetical protein